MRVSVDNLNRHHTASLMKGRGGRRGQTRDPRGSRASLQWRRCRVSAQLSAPKSGNQQGRRGWMPAPRQCMGWPLILVETERWDVATRTAAALRCGCRAPPCRRHPRPTELFLRCHAGHTFMP